jgi:predicted Na+-dependent transporter
MRRVEVPTYTATVFVANRLGMRAADAICQTFCDGLGECVTVDPSNYI